MQDKAAISTIKISVMHIWDTEGAIKFRIMAETPLKYVTTFAKL